MQTLTWIVQTEHPHILSCVLFHICERREKQAFDPNLPHKHDLIFSKDTNGGFHEV